MTLPKTIDAFAFRGFEARDCFDFKAWYELARDSCTYEILFKMNKIASEALDRLIQRQRRIRRHCRRLVGYQARLAQKIALGSDAAQVKSQIKHAMELEDRYRQIGTDLRELRHALEEGIDDNNLIARRVFMQGFSARLRQARMEAGLTQTELANRVGVKRSSYNAFETARNEPNASVVVALSKELNTPVDWLLGV